MAYKWGLNGHAIAGGCVLAACADVVLMSAGRIGRTAVVCKGGSVRSHLGILTREYQIPCLMNAQVAGLEEGDRVQVEYSVPAEISYAAEAVEGQGHARVWKPT